MQKQMSNTHGPDSTGVVAALFTVSFIAVVGWVGFRVVPRYADCALNGEFANGGTHCRYEAPQINEYSFLLRP